MTTSSLEAKEARQRQRELRDGRYRQRGDETDEPLKRTSLLTLIT